MRRAFTLIELMIVIAIIAIIAAIAIPNLLEARKSGNEAAALGSLKAITTAQTLFRNKQETFANLDALGSLNLIDSVLASGSKQGYSLGTFPAAGVGGTLIAESAYLWAAGASPIVPGNTGDRHFYTTQTGVIYYTLDTGGNDLGVVVNTGQLSTSAGQALVEAAFIPIGK